jgi:transposase
MKYYAGLDVAMKETFMCVVDETGKRVFESKASTSPQTIHEELAKSGVSLEKIGLEAGSLSKFLTKGLQELDLNAICIDARKMAAILSVTINKTDKNDARGIADAMRCNHYKEVNLRNCEDNAMSIFLNSRSTLVEHRGRLKNTVRGFLKTYGLCLGEVSHTKFSKIVCEVISDLPAEVTCGIEGLLKSYDLMNEQIKKMDKQLNELCKKDKEVQRLMEIPGVGMVVAMSYKADIGDPTRFEKSESVGAYYGMTPRQYSSGETVKMGCISKCGSKNMRTLLTEAAIVMLTRSKVWSPLKAWGIKLMKKHGFKKAAMAVGRKLSVIMHRMLITGENFRFSNNEQAQAAA